MVSGHAVVVTILLVANAYVAYRVADALAEALKTLGW